jgi:hypothetical protein
MTSRRDVRPTCSGRIKLSATHGIAFESKARVFGLLLLLWKLFQLILRHRDGWQQQQQPQQRSLDRMTYVGDVVL